MEHLDAQPLATVRASSWPNLFDCSYKWYWQNIMGLRSPSGGPAHLGTAVHAGTAAYDQAILDGKFITITEAVDASRESLAKPKEEVRWDEGMSPADADRLAVKLTTRYCTDIAPTRTYTAVELKCTALDIATAHGVVRVTGTTDRVRQLEDGRKGISDVKTGGRATETTEKGGRRAVTKGHHIQLGIYTLMAEQASGERMDGPAEIIGLQTSKETPCATGEIADVKTPLLGDGKFPGLIEIAAGMLKSGVFPPNPKSVLCSNKFCPAHASHCKYHD